MGSLLTGWLSIAGLVGLFMGLVVGLMNYAVIVSFAEKRLRAGTPPRNAAERQAVERKVALMRKVVLVTDLVVIGGIGYWFGRTIGG